uniref:BacI n=1 Tax=Bacillus sp. Xin1 TaxID=2740676 RepID=A0A7D5HUK9_9BACI|nr:BacI [Bacillus sp. Xin1]
MKIINYLFLAILFIFQIHQILKHRYAYKNTQKKYHKNMVIVFSIILVLTSISIIATYLNI